MSATLSNQTAVKRASRRGITLIELLIVILIFLMITAAAIPVLRPALGGRAVREAGRQVATFMNGAKVRAAATGRPVGVYIEPFRFALRPGDPAPAPGAKRPALPLSMSLSYLEVPQPYAGDFAASQIQVTVNPSTKAAAVTLFPAMDSGWVGLLRPGDRIQFNYQGPIYRLFAKEAYRDRNKNGQYDMGEPFADHDGNGSFTGPTAAMLNPNDGTFNTQPSTTDFWGFIIDDETAPLTVNMLPNNYAFQVFRQPVKSSEPPLELPEGIVIDLQWSGMGAIFGLTADSAVIFAPSGAVDRLYTGAASGRATGQVFFLIGKREKVPATFFGEAYLTTDPPAEQVRKHNWKDLENLWIVVNPSGVITTSENAKVADAELPPTGIPLARRFARESQNIGGR